MKYEGLNRLIEVKEDGVHWKIGDESGIDPLLSTVLDRAGYEASDSAINGLTWFNVDGEIHLCGPTCYAVIKKQDDLWEFDGTTFNQLADAIYIAENKIWEDMNLGRPRFVDVRLRVEPKLGRTFVTSMCLPSKGGALTFEGPPSNLDISVVGLAHRLANFFANGATVNGLDGDPVELDVNDLEWRFELMEGEEPPEEALAEEEPCSSQD